MLRLTYSSLTDNMEQAKFAQKTRFFNIFNLYCELLGGEDKREKGMGKISNHLSGNRTLILFLKLCHSVYSTDLMGCERGSAIRS